MSALPRRVGCSGACHHGHDGCFFNPWRYQNTEQVWAGLAHAIISQVTDRLRPGDRERFWLELNLARIDRLAIRRRVYRLVLERLLPFLVTFVLAAVVAGILWVIGAPFDAARWALAGGAGAITVGAVIRYFVFRGQRATTGFTQLLSGPMAGVVTTETKGLFDTTFPDPHVSVVEAVSSTYRCCVSCWARW